MLACLLLFEDISDRKHYIVLKELFVNLTETADLNPVIFGVVRHPCSDQNVKSLK